jgi:hypothetical protein
MLASPRIDRLLRKRSRFDYVFLILETPMQKHQKSSWGCTASTTTTCISVSQFASAEGRRIMAEVIPTFFESAFLACFRNGQRRHLIALHVQIHSWVIPTIWLRASCTLLPSLMMIWGTSGYRLEIERWEIKVKWLFKQQGTRKIIKVVKWLTVQLGYASKWYIDLTLAALWHQGVSCVLIRKYVLLLMKSS